MKRVVRAILVTIIAIGLCIPVSAAGLNDNLTPVTKTAYMDIEKATPELKQKILQAREEIILSNSWVADDTNGRILDKNGNIIKELPHFSDLFPEDWEPPVLKHDTGEQIGEIIPIVAERSSKELWQQMHQEDVWLKNPPVNTGSPAFYSFSTTGFEGTPNEYYLKTVSTEGIYKNPAEDAQYNCGYTNTDTGKSYGYTVGLENGQQFAIDPPQGISLSVHASTHTNVGIWLMTIHTLMVWP